MEEATNVLAVSTFVLPNLETILVSVSAVPQVMQSSSDQEHRSDFFGSTGGGTREEDHSPLRGLGPVNQTMDTASATSRLETMTTTTIREERRPDRSSDTVPMAHL